MMGALGVLAGWVILVLIWLVPVFAFLFLISAVADVYKAFGFGRKEVSDDTAPKKMPAPPPKRDGRKKKSCVQVVDDFSDEHKLPEFFWSD